VDINCNLGGRKRGVGKSFAREEKVKEEKDGKRNVQKNSSRNW